MKYTVITSTGKVMTFYLKEVAEIYAINFNGTLICDDVLKSCTAGNNCDIIDL